MATQKVAQENRNTDGKPERAIDVRDMDALSEKLGQARALASTLYGDSGDGFETCSNEIKSNVHWLLASLLDDAWKSLERISRARSAAIR